MLDIGKVKELLEGTDIEVSLSCRRWGKPMIKGEFNNRSSSLSFSIDSDTTEESVVTRLLFEQPRLVL